MAGRPRTPDEDKGILVPFRLPRPERDLLNELVSKGERNTFIRAAVLAALSKLKRQAKAEHNQK